MEEKRSIQKTVVRAPEMGDTAVDLKGLPLVDLTRDEVRVLLKPRNDWQEVAEQVVQVYPKVAAELGIAKFEPSEAISAPIALMHELAPWEAWLEKALEKVKETRLKAANDAWRSVLKVYRRANDIAVEEPRVGKTFRFVSDFLANESTRGPATTTAPTDAPPTNVGPR